MRRAIILGLSLLLLSVPLFTTSPTKAADSPPLLFGWGGILAVGAVHFDSSSPSSVVFSGEQASNTEVTFAEMKSRGYNAARIAIIDPGNQPDSGSYDSNAWHRTLQLASHFGITVIGDDHEYDCPSTSFWRTVFQDTPQATYPNVVWEPKNEPHCSSLAADDQAVIDLARGMGDTRWFVLGCNNDCSGSSPSGAMPIVTDPQNHVFYDFHEYFFYTSHSNEWNDAAATAFADRQIAGVQEVMSALGRPFLGTEWGAETDCFSCANQEVPGSAGYAAPTLAYLSEIVSKSHQLGIGYTIWNAGDWNDAPAGITGALDTFGACPPLNGPTLPCLPRPSLTPAPLTASFTFTPASPLAGQAVSFTGSAVGGTGPYTFSWAFGDGATGTGTIVTHTYTSSGPFNTTLTMSDSLAATSSVTHTIAVSSQTSACSAADFNGNGKVDLLDVSIFALHFGYNSGDPLYSAKYDLNNDGTINIFDLVLVAQVYRQTC